LQSATSEAPATPPAGTGAADERRPLIRCPIVTLLKRLRRASPKTGERRSLRQIAAELAAAGYLNERGQLFNPKSIKAMLEQ
jgi:hypothetical protein